jgi:hypothetical protein
MPSGHHEVASDCPPRLPTARARVPAIVATACRSVPVSGDTGAGSVQRLATRCDAKPCHVPSSLSQRVPTTVTIPSRVIETPRSIAISLPVSGNSTSRQRFPFHVCTSGS